MAGLGLKTDCDLLLPPPKKPRQTRSGRCEPAADLAQTYLLELLNSTLVNTTALVDQMTYEPNV